jgi:hypothetical protein
MTTGIGAGVLPGEETAVSKEQFYIWEVDADKKTKQLNPQLQPEYFNVDTVIMGLNERFPQVQLERRKIGHDTLYAEIKNAEFLTERMGSFGAEHYIAMAVLNLTSANGINFVRIDFTEGSHASPDVWSRQNFAAYKEVE